VLRQTALFVESDFADFSRISARFGDRDA